MIYNKMEKVEKKFMTVLLLIVLVLIINAVYFATEIHSHYVRADMWRYIDLYLQPIYNNQFDWTTLWIDHHSQPLTALTFIIDSVYFNLNGNLFFYIGVFSKVIIGFFLIFLIFKSLPNNNYLLFITTLLIIFQWFSLNSTVEYGWPLVLRANLWYLLMLIILYNLDKIIRDEYNKWHLIMYIFIVYLVVFINKSFGYIWLIKIKNKLTKQQSSSLELNKVNETYILKDNLVMENQSTVSIVVVTYNNLELTKKCLESMEKFNNYTNCEIIVVDNMSQEDNTREFLQKYEKEHENVKVILNDINGGFSYGNNIGIKVANGEYIILLNNDTIVTPNWIERLITHFSSDPTIGMVGPRTNNIGNESKIDVSCRDINEMIEFSEKLYQDNKGKLFKDIRVLAFFCVAIKREVFDKIGLLDEVFGIGMFEDDDFCERAKAAGYQLVCADDVFIHHHLGATFDKEPAKWKQELFKKNKAIYESRYGKWIPHKYRKEK